jgi:conjugative transfer signal peptidase TraF
VLVILGVVFGGLAFGAWTGGLWLNLSSSMPIGIYRTVRGPIEKGAIAVICLPESVALFALERGYVGHGSCPGGVEPLGKTVAATAGDNVVVDTDGVWINGRPVPGSRPLRYDARRRALPRLAGLSIRLCVGQLFLLATRRAGSFDSRYFGVLRASDVRAAVVPVGMVSFAIAESHSPDSATVAVDSVTMQLMKAVAGGRRQ